MQYFELESSWHAIFNEDAIGCDKIIHIVGHGISQVNKVCRRHPVVPQFAAVEIGAGFCHELVGIKEFEPIAVQEVYEIVQLFNAMPFSIKTDGRYLAKHRNGNA
jgi:hypothetical protein